MNISLKRLVIFCFTFLSLIVSVNAQVLNINDLKNANVSKLSNDQIKEFVTNYKAQGYTTEQVGQVSMQNGMAPTEWEKLKARIIQMEKTEKAESFDDKKNEREFDKEIKEKRAESQKDQTDQESDQIPIFGSSLFKQADLTFQPNLKLATPQNYVIGPDDELNIEIYGYSESQDKARVSPEGYISLSGVGRIQVSGLTIQQATKVVGNRLSSIYSTINTGQTSVSITLNNIRTVNVLIAGEVYKPGTYSLPSVSSVFNALNSAGGPNRNGSFRNVKVYRNNELVSNIDIYDFLSEGVIKNNIILQDQDIIKVEPYVKRVEVQGEVKNKGYFEAKENETMADIIRFSGGFLTGAYKDRVTVLRNTDKKRSVSDVPYSNFGSFVVQDGDIFAIGKVLDKFENRVKIEGAVFRPGTYSLEDGTSLKMLIEKAEGLTEDAFLTRGLIIREKSDLRKEVIAFNTGDIVSGKEKDITLKKEDLVRVQSVLEMKEKSVVSIFGEIKNDGEYEFYDKMSLKDLIFIAGGFREKAELRNVEVSRMIKDPEELLTGNSVAKVFVFNVDKDLNFNEAEDFKLEHLDQVMVRPMSGYMDVKKIMLEGEVQYPGNYTLLSKTDRISDVIKRAGGLNSFSYPEGAFLIRSLESSIAEQKLEKELFKGMTSDDTDTVKEKKFLQQEGIVGINLEKIMRNPGSKWDILLENGDIIKIPRLLQTVQVSGEVLLPSHIRFDYGYNFKDYVEGSGGFSVNALKRKSVVIYANGTAKSTKRFLFFRSYPDIEPGAKIYVPEKPKKENIKTTEAISVATSVTTLAALIFSMFR